MKMDKETKGSAIVTVSHVIAITINMFMFSLNPILGLLLYFLILASYIYFSLVFEVAVYTLYLSTKEYRHNHIKNHPKVKNR